jgi:hypothetical protein
MRKIQIFIYFLLVTITLQSCKVNRAYKALEVYNYFKAKKLFEPRVDNNIVAAPFGLSLIYGRKDNPFYNLDSAYKFVYRADSNYSKLSERKLQKLNKLGIDSLRIHRWKDSIDVKQFEQVVKANKLELAIDYIEKHPSSIRMELAVRLRDSLAFNKAGNENTSKAFKHFLSNYPNAEEAYQAQNRYDNLLYQEQTASNQLDDYRAFVNSYPDSPYLREAQDSVYRKATANRNIEVYYQFIQQNPDNPNVNEAWRNLYKLYMIDYSLERIAEFRIDYPDYPFVDDLMMDIELASKQFLPIKVDSLWGFIDTLGALMIKAEYNSVEPYQEGLALVVQAGKVGFINKSGEEVIPIIYDDAESFESSLTIVSKADVYGIIDRTNKVVLPLKYEYVGRFNDGLAIVANDTAYGYVNQSGEVVIPITLDYAGDFSQGLAIIEQQGKKGVINTQGRLVVPIEYNWLEPFQSNGLARAKKDSLYGLIDRQAAVVLPFKYDAIGEFSEGLALVANEEQYGYVNDSAQWIIESKFDFRRDALNWGKFDYSYAKYMLKEKFGIIDTSGHRVFPAIFENIGSYNDSSLIAIKKRGKWGFTNQDLNLIIPYQYDFAETFVHGVAKVKLNGLWGLINKEGDWLVKAEYDNIQIYRFGYLLKKADKMGMLDFSLEEAIPLLYDEIQIYNESFLTLEKIDSYVYYHISDGEIIHLIK